MTTESFVGSAVFADSARDGRPAPARRIDHVAIATRDAESAADWYVRTLAMTIVGDEVVNAVGARLIYLVPQGSDPEEATMLQLVEPLTGGAIRNFIERRGEGLHHVCFAVDSISRLLARVSQDPSSVFRGGRQRLACFMDEQPLGVILELTETYPVDHPPVSEIPVSEGTGR